MGLESRSFMSSQTLATIKSQNTTRDARVPFGVIDRLIDKLDPPTLPERHELEIVTEN